MTDLDGIAGGFGGVLPSGGSGPPDLAAGQLLGLPAGILFQPVIIAALGVPVTQTGPAADLIRNVVLKVAVHSWSPAAWSGARRVPDLGEVPQHHPGIMAFRLMAVVAPAGGNRPDLEEQIPLPWGPGGEPPRPVAARRSGLIGGSEGKPGLAGRVGPGGCAWFVCFAARDAVAGGRGPGAAVSDGVSEAIGDGHSPGRPGAAGCGGGQVPGEIGVDGPDAGQFAWSVR